MLADLDLLLIAVFATADDLLPEKSRCSRSGCTAAGVIVADQGYAGRELAAHLRRAPRRAVPAP